VVIEVQLRTIGRSQFQMILVEDASQTYLVVRALATNRSLEFELVYLMLVTRSGPS